MYLIRLFVLCVFCLQAPIAMSDWESSDFYRQGMNNTLLNLQTGSGSSHTGGNAKYASDYGYTENDSAPAVIAENPWKDSQWEASQWSEVAQPWGNAKRINQQRDSAPQDERYSSFVDKGLSVMKRYVSTPTQGSNSLTSDSFSYDSVGSGDNKWNYNSSKRTFNNYTNLSQVNAASNNTSSKNIALPRFQPLSKQNQPVQDTTNWYSPVATDRYVTPEVLASLKQSKVYLGNRRDSLPSWQSTAKLSRQQSSNDPSQNVNYSYQAVQPYRYQIDKLAKQSSLLNGSSLSSVPFAAMGGLPPINVNESLPQVLSTNSKPFRTTTLDPFQLGLYSDYNQ